MRQPPQDAAKEALTVISVLLEPVVLFVVKDF